MLTFLLKNFTLNRLLTIVSIASIGFGMFKGCQEEKERIARLNAEDELLAKISEVTTYKDELGRTVTKTIEYSKTIKQLEQSNDSIEIRLANSLKALDIKESQINSMMTIDVESSSKGLLEQVSQLEWSGDSINSKQDSIPVLKWDDGFTEVVIKGDSIRKTCKHELDVFDAKRKVDRNFFLWRWIGWKKVVDRDMVQIVSTNPDDKIKARTVRIKKR